MIDRIVGARRNVTFESNLLVIELIPMDYLHFHFTSDAVFLSQFLNKLFMKHILNRLETIVLGSFYLLSYFSSAGILTSIGYSVFKIYILFFYLHFFFIFWLFWVHIGLIHQQKFVVDLMFLHDVSLFLHFLKLFCWLEYILETTLDAGYVT